MRIGWMGLNVALIGLLAAATVAVAAERGVYKNYELPPYDVVSRDGPFEIRDYGAHLLALVNVRGSREGAINRGFRALADYIFGGNEGGAKIAMTVPVAQALSDVDDQVWTVSFMMPSRYSLEDLPQADNVAIQFVEATGDRQAVMRFSGRATSGRLDDMSRALLAEVAAAGFDAASAPRYYFYDGPMTLPWNRRNEVAVAVN